MTLQSQIEHMQQQMSGQIPAETLAIMRDSTAALAGSGITENSLKAGDSIPAFTLLNARGEQVNSQALLEQGPLVLSFYRGGWCPYCNLELKALAEALPEIEAVGAQLVAISPELPGHELETVESHKIDFDVLSDVRNRVARMFGLVFTLAEELRPVYAGFGIDLPSCNGDASFELPMPATYVIGSDGVILHAFVNADYTQRMEPAEIIRLLRESRAEHAGK